MLQFHGWKNEMYLCKKEEKYLSYVKNFQFLVKDKKSYNLSKKKKYHIKYNSKNMKDKIFIGSVAIYIYNIYTIFW